MQKILVLALLLHVAAAEAATRLTYLIGGQPKAIQWSSSSFPIPYYVSRDIPARLPQAQLVIPRAFSAWQSVEETAIRFRDAGLVDAPSGRDGKNVVTVTDELFANSGFIAYTTNWFENDGIIVESDIQIDMTAAKGDFDLEALVEHEIGHFLGLDHSAVLSSVMFPYIGLEDLGGLDSDDIIAVSTIYPRRAFGGVLRGEVRNGSAVFGAQVVVVSRDGAPVSTGLTDQNGRFELLGVPEGDYTLYVEPLDGPVESRNLSGIWRDGHSGFRTQFLTGKTITVRGGEVHENLTLQLDSRPSSLNARWIGVFPEHSADIRLATTALKIRPGDTVCIAVGGDGFVNGMTTFEILNHGFTRVSDFRYGMNYIWATFKVAPDTPASSVVIRVANGDEAAALTGALRVERVSRRRPVRP